MGKEIFGYIGELSQSIIAEKLLGEKTEVQTFGENIPVRPPVMCAGCPHRGLFYCLSKLKVMVSGDIGCYTLGAAAPLCAVDTTVCMGASISGLHGFNKARGAEAEKNSVAVIGDSTFMHSGMTGLVNIAYNATNSTVIILDNSITGMTGHQQNPTTGKNLKGDPAAAVNLEELCKAIGIKRVRVVDPYSLAETEAAIKEELAVEEPSVIISRRPCALLKYVKHKPALKVEADKCKGCKACMKLGCPAISMNDGKAVIDHTQCVGCGICQEQCKFAAIN
ncbi:indolepyruvate ferredoxin oxidoreductase alpha subunit [Ruminococcus sp. CAG:624]|nr:indolepyruvate ferredoxin oxidoreductase alpha subunit [Ruminococcus sp. CAG:624]